MKFTMNVGNIDRLIRVILGVVLLLLPLFMFNGVTLVLAIVGVIPLVTGLVGVCPIYALFKINTRETQ